MYVGSVICTEPLRMYVGYTNSFSVRFFALLNSYVCRLNKIFIVFLFCPFLLDELYVYVHDICDIAILC